MLSAPPITERRAPADGVALNVAVGAPNGPPLVLLHGVTRRWDDWLGLWPSLATRWELHAVDHRGHGRSDRAPADAYRVADYVPGVAAYVASLAEPAVVLGHSLGAMVAAGVAARVPDRVRAVVLEDPTWEMTGARIDETGFPDLFRAYTPHAGSARPIGEIARALAAAPVRAPGGAVVPLGTLRDAAQLRSVAASLRRLDPAVLPVILEKRWLDGHDVAATLGAIACPTLFLRGDFACGGALPDVVAEVHIAAIRDVVPLKLAGVGHNIHGTQPDAMLRAVLPFLAALVD